MPTLTNAHQRQTEIFGRYLIYYQSTINVVNTHLIIVALTIILVNITKKSVYFVIIDAIHYTTFKQAFLIERNHSFVNSAIVFGRFPKRV